MANNWFNSNSVPKVITFCVLTNLLSIAIGGALPGLLVKKTAGVDEIK